MLEWVAMITAVVGGVAQIVQVVLTLRRKHNLPAGQKSELGQHPPPESDGVPRPNRPQERGRPER